MSPVTASYGDHPAQRLDVYSPQDASEVQEPVPVVIYIHGGGWSAGDKSDVPGPLVNLLTATGYAVASINYRLTGQARFPAQLRDTRAAIAYLRSHASALGVDPDQIVLSGDSAGGHLAQLAAVTDPLPESNSGVAADGGIRGVVSYYGLSDLLVLTGQRADAGCRGRYFEPAGPAGTLFPDGLTEEELDHAAAEASPVTHVDSTDPPMLLLHGTEDCIVPAAQSAQMRDALAAVGVSAELMTVDAEHSAPRFYTDPTLNAAVLEFLRVVTS